MYPASSLTKFHPRQKASSNVLLTQHSANRNDWSSRKAHMEVAIALMGKRRCYDYAPPLHQSSPQVLKTNPTAPGNTIFMLSKIPVSPLIRAD